MSWGNLGRLPFILYAKGDINDEIWQECHGSVGNERSDCRVNRLQEKWSAPARKSISRQKKPGSRSKRLVRKSRTRQKMPQNNSPGEARRLELPMATRNAVFSFQEAVLNTWGVSTMRWPIKVHVKERKR